MKKSWKKDGRTHETDGYTEHYLFTDDSVTKAVWEASVFVGPEAIDCSSVWIIRDNHFNKVPWITSREDAMYIARRYNNVNTQKLKP